MKTGWLTLAAYTAWTAAIVLLAPGCGQVCPDGIVAEGYICPDLPHPPPPVPLPDLTPIEGQDKFASIAWEALGQTGAPPLIHWRRDLTCGKSGRYYLHESTGTCADGNYPSGATFVVVAELPKLKPHRFATCHEYQHFIDWRDRGVADVNHEGAAFQEGGAVSVCELAQMAAGW
jgi:hypothetical protein